jgi:hypothetical protein
MLAVPAAALVASVDHAADRSNAAAAFRRQIAARAGPFVAVRGAPRCAGYNGHDYEHRPSSR